MTPYVRKRHGKRTAQLQRDQNAADGWALSLKKPIKGAVFSPKGPPRVRKTPSDPKSSWSRPRPGGWVAAMGSARRVTDRRAAQHHLFRLKTHLLRRWAGTKARRPQALPLATTDLARAGPVFQGRRKGVRQLEGWSAKEKAPA